MPPAADDAPRPTTAGLSSLPLRLRFGLLAVLGASLLTLVLSELSVRAALDSGATINRVLDRRATANRLLALLVDVETGQRGYLLTGQPDYLQPYRSALQELDRISLALRSLVPPGSTISARLDRISALASERLGIATATIALASSGHTEDAIAIVRAGRGKRLMDTIRTELATVEGETQLELRELETSQARATTRSRISMLVSTLLSIGLLLYVTRLALAQAAAQEALRVQAKDDARRMQEVIAARTSELAGLSSHLQTVAEREKAELARNLHDEMGGLLTAARMDLSWLQGAAAGKDPAVLDKLSQLSDELAQAMNVKRRVVESLRPALLDHFGLATALQNHFEDICHKAGINCTATIPDGLNDLPDDIAIALFRVGQESLTNIVRHSRAQNVRLDISVDGEHIVLGIDDDGIGMDEEARQARKSHGINGMRHRVEGLGGQFRLDSAQGAGTQIHIRIPRSLPPPPG